MFKKIVLAGLVLVAIMLAAGYDPRNLKRWADSVSEQEGQTMSGNNARMGWGS